MDFVIDPGRPAVEGFLRGEEKRAENGLSCLKEKHLALWKSKQDPGTQPTLWKIAVSRRMVRLATQRNRWRRRIREVLRRQRSSIFPGYQATLKVHSVKPPTKFAVLEKEITNLLEKSGLLIKEGK